MPNSQSGQTLLAIVFVMVIALSVGVSMSNRFISTLKISTRSYTAHRAKAIAESAMERILLLDVAALEESINNNLCSETCTNLATCGSDCYLEQTNDDGVVEYATVHLTELGNSTDIFYTKLTTEGVTEINLDGYPETTELNICWNDPISGALPSIIGYQLYGVTGGYYADNFAYNSIGSTENNGFFTAQAAYGYDNCMPLVTRQFPKALRLRSTHQNLDIAVIPNETATLPSQGILIKSIGHVLDTTNQISAIKSFPIAPVLFDFILYQKSDTEAFSNSN